MGLLTASRDEVLVKAGAVMRRYHDSGLEFKTSFDPVAKIDEYKAILDEHNYGKRYEGWERMVEALERIRAAYAKQPPRRVPCHNDALAENFMLQGEQMRVIDWEYGGMNDGYYDIACVCVENPLDARCEDVFFRAYCGGEPSEEAKARLLINKFLVTTENRLTLILPAWRRPAFLQRGFADGLLRCWLPPCRPQIPSRHSRFPVAAKGI